MNSKCRSCGARVTWAITQKGNSMPLDAQSVLDGKFFLVTDYADGSKREQEEYETISTESDNETAANYRATNRSRYTSHFATCPNAAKHRKAKGVATP